MTRDEYTQLIGDINTSKVTKVREMLATGMSVGDVATELGITPRTVYRYRVTMAGRAGPG